MATAVSILTSGTQIVDLPNPYENTPWGCQVAPKIARSQVVVSEAMATGQPVKIGKMKRRKKDHSAAAASKASALSSHQPPVQCRHISAAMPPPQPPSHTAAASKESSARKPPSAAKWVVDILSQCIQCKIRGRHHLSHPHCPSCGCDSAAQSIRRNSWQRHPQEVTKTKLCFSAPHQANQRVYLVVCHRRRSATGYGI